MLTSQIRWLVASALILAACTTVSRQAPISLPFSSHANQVSILATIGGKPLTFLVDTAVDPSAIDGAVARDLGLKALSAGGAIEGVGTETATAYPSVIPDLMIAGKSVGAVEVLVNDMTRLRERFGAPLDGILGYSLLKKHAVMIDYRANRITFYEGPARQDPKSCRTVHRFPLRFLSDDDRLILVPGLKIEGVEVPAMLDTGSSNNLRIGEGAPAIAPIRPLLPKGEAGSVVGARGQAAVRRGLLNGSVTLGPFRADRPEVALIGVRNPRVPVSIGNRFLRTLGVRLLVDIPGGVVGLYSDCRGAI